MFDKCKTNHYEKNISIIMQNQFRFQISLDAINFHFEIKNKMIPLYKILKIGGPK